MSPNETELRAGLRHEAQRVDTIGDFASAAMALEHRRGRRRGVAIAATAFVAAAAVAVPMGLSHGRGRAPAPPVPGSTSQREPTGSATGSPTGDGSQHPQPSATSTSPAAAGPGVFALDDTIRVGDEVIHLERGTQVENLAVLSNGGFVLQSHLVVDGSSSEMELLSPAGRVVKRLGVSGSFAVSPDGTRVIAQDGRTMRLTVLAPDGSVLASRATDRYPAAVVGDFVYLQGDSAAKSLEWNYVTGRTRTLPGHVAAVSADRTRAALQWTEAAADPMGDFCWSVIDLTDPGFRSVIERCGSKGNPNLFQPTAFSGDGSYLVGSNYVDGGYWFSAAVVRVSDGAMVLGGSQADGTLVAGWTWRLDDDDTLLVSRNPSAPKTEANSLQRCTLDLSCTVLGAPLPLTGMPVGSAHYVVPRDVPR